MEAQDVGIRQVPHAMIRAVLDTEPIPPYPEFDGAPLTLERVENKGAWANGGRRKKALRRWHRYTSEVNEVMRQRTDKLATLLFVRGVTEEPAPIEEWGADLVALGVREDDPIRVKLLWVHHLLPAPMAKLDLLTRIMALSGLETGLLDSIKALFQAALIQSGEVTAASLVRDRTEGPELATLAEGAAEAAGREPAEALGDLIEGIGAMTVPGKPAEG